MTGQSQRQAWQHNYNRFAHATGAPAVASRVRLGPDGTQQTEYLCELDLAEDRMSSRLGGPRSLFDEFFSDFLGGAPTREPSRSAQPQRQVASAQEAVGASSESG